MHPALHCLKSDLQSQVKSSFILTDSEKMPAIYLKEEVVCMPFPHLVSSSNLQLSVPPVCLYKVPERN